MKIETHNIGRGISEVSAIRNTGTLTPVTIVFGKVGEPQILCTLDKKQADRLLRQLGRIMKAKFPSTYAKEIGEL